MAIRLHASILAALLTASAASAQVADRGGNRMAPLAVVEAVTPAEAATRSALHCTAAGELCLRAWRESATDSWLLDLHDRLPAGTGAEPARRIPLVEGIDAERDEIAIWPHLVREASGALIVGVELYRRTGFSGGGAGETTLRLLRLATPEAEPELLLELPYGYGSLIRACFSEADMALRAGACHDEFEYGASLLLDPATEAGASAFLYAAHARAFPRGALTDESEGRQFTSADLIWEPDPACSYRRRFAPDADGNYAPDAPLPDCDLYRIP